MSGWPETGGGVGEPPPPDASAHAPVARPDELRPLQRRATLTRVALVLIAVASIVATVFDVAERSLLARVESGEPVTLSELSASDDRQVAISIVVFLLWVVTTAFFIAWLHRAYTNLSALGVDGLRYGTGWAIGAWFVPFLNLVRPIQIVNDVWRGSRPYLDDRLGWRGGPVPRVFGVWWGVWLVGSFVGSIAARLLFEAEDSRDESSATVFIASDALTAVAAILAVIVVDRTTARQSASAARVLGGEQPAPPTQWLRGRGRIAVAAALCGLAAGAGALVVAAQPSGTTPSGDGGSAETGPDSGSDTLSLTDDFSDPGSGWIVEESEDASYAYDDGEYRMTVTSPDTTWFSLFNLGLVVDPIRIEADARLGSPALDDSYVGLGCFVTDLYGYLATIWPDGSYAIGIDPVDTEELEVLVEGTATDAIAGADATNRLGLLCESGPPAIITLTVAGRTVGEARHDEGLGAFEVAGFIAGSGTGETTAYFDNFAVASPSGR